ncbi:ATP-binding cassette domain-containing protein [Staphylococcus delphini]|uniref:Molybdenum ABC transporter ATP-binding protein n=1 Tax=Staphylococcus delphini TaxID=53344 RepID=A0AAX0QVH7_9STAP|nr:ATP-binding cassette domain-containing protein [Staphylococcus delphini]NBK47566.1 ATP-binding cassette domain-containing protein [Staphylococcus delphini]PCF33723.1 molybdenum ABC transporter ATP-binding protein [Staphylococcus delphini]PCF50359.1 molybdenum ABC transporter ATP-binding protein [Staphylococcus delphini]PNZ95214.1 molybdenum ABC transporter ATP-binding protein [Staphylococcus delphini]RIZ55628.1 molybdenum ABC transporter ATP-binding protein [Staphylococcus delphini]
MLKLQINMTINQRHIGIQIQSDQPKIYAIQGASGIGKTTLLNVIAGICNPDYGKIEINGRVLTDTSQHRHVLIRERHIGYLFQDYQLFPHMTVLDNITFMTHWNTHIADLMKHLNIEHLKHVYPERCSGGEKQRVALARALSMRPEILLLDEPFSSLDEGSRKESMDLVKRIFNEWHIPIIFVTHSKWEAETLADEVIVIE